MKWQLIETTPKDGTKIVVFDGSRVNIGWFVRWLLLRNAVKCWETDLLTYNAVLSGATGKQTTECGASPRPPRTRG